MRLWKTEKYWISIYFLLLLFFIAGYAFAAESSKVKNEHNNKISTNQLAFYISMISIFYFMNAINMFDGIDVQTPLYLVLIFVFLILKGEKIVIFLLIPGIFFLYLNFMGKCFLGNSGSYFLGFIISTLKGNSRLEIFIKCFT